MKGYADVSYLAEGVLGGPGASISNVTVVREKDQWGLALSDDRGRAGGRGEGTPSDPELWPQTVAGGGAVISIRFG